ncbi:hypothetical protein F4780DRAFT_249838, partial [Xylariomycetidae sp. FL0641]
MFQDGHPDAATTITLHTPAQAKMEEAPSAIPSTGATGQWPPLGTNESLWYIAATVLVVLVTFTLSSSKSNLKNIPLINPRPPLAFTDTEIKKTFRQSSQQLMDKARSLYPGRPYRMLTDLGEQLVLPPAFADEIRNEPKLSFTAGILQDFHAGIPGFDGLVLGAKDDQLIQLVAKKQLTKSLNSVTEPLSEEASLALAANWGDSTEWRELPVKETLLDVVARLSSRVF